MVERDIYGKERYIHIYMVDIYTYIHIHTHTHLLYIYIYTLTHKHTHVCVCLLPSHIRARPVNKLLQHIWGPAAADANLPYHIPGGTGFIGPCKPSRARRCQQNSSDNRSWPAAFCLAFGTGKQATSPAAEDGEFATMSHRFPTWCGTRTGKQCRSRGKL